MPQMYIYLQLTVMAPKGSRERTGMGTAMAKMQTFFEHLRQLLIRDHIKRFVLEHIGRLIQIYNVSRVLDEWAWDLCYDIIFLDPVTTRHISQF
jgi:hypothetical protein